MDKQLLIYSNPVLAGQHSYLRDPKAQNPIDGRMHANHKTLWRQGWLKQRAIECRGIEIAHDVFSGCTQTGGDCPECGK